MKIVAKISNNEGCAYSCFMNCCFKVSAKKEIGIQQNLPIHGFVVEPIHKI